MNNHSMGSGGAPPSRWYRSNCFHFHAVFGPFWQIDTNGLFTVFAIKIEAIVIEFDEEIVSKSKG